MKWFLKLLLALCLFFMSGYALLYTHASNRNAYHSVQKSSRRSLHAGFQSVENRQLLSIRAAHNSPDDDFSKLELNSRDNEDEDEKLLCLESAAFSCPYKHIHSLAYSDGSRAKPRLSYNKFFTYSSSAMYILHRAIRI